MPLLIEAETKEAIELGELVEQLETSNFDARDEEGFAGWGGELRKLANNRRFLADMVLEELKQRCSNQQATSQYSSQVIMLYGRSDRFMIRANFWPALGDSVVRHSGTAPFFYGLAHDHNFSFLTVGYLGPGYWSEYYEYDYEKVAGYAGEKVDLRFVERAPLSEGKVLFYRAHKDVHLQLPADAMSVSINIAETSYVDGFRDQYRFDVERGEIRGILTRVSTEPLLALSAHFGGENGRDLIEAYAASHPSDRLRFAALKAQASALHSVDDRIALFERAARGGNPYLSAMARRSADELQRSRRWIEAPSAALASLS